MQDLRERMTSVTNSTRQQELEGGGRTENDGQHDQVGGGGGQRVTRERRLEEMFYSYDLNGEIFFFFTIYSLGLLLLF